MEEKRYTITLADGTELNDLRLNGNNFISDQPVVEDVFEDNCTPLTISDGETEEVHENAELVQIVQHGSEYWMVFRDLSEEEIENAKMRSDIEYLAMMTDVEL